MINVRQISISALNEHLIDGKMVNTISPLFDGKTLFNLKATHGLPLDFALDQIINKRGLMVEWPGFVKAARENGWWDFQIMESIKHAMQDAELSKHMQMGIEHRLMAWILANPHPEMKGEA